MITKLNKILYKIILLLIIVIYTMVIPLGTTYAFQDIRGLTNEFSSSVITSKPEVPVTPEDKPTKPTPEKPAGKPPKTGDDAEPKQWLIISVISVFILRYILFFKKRKERL